MQKRRLDKVALPLKGYQLIDNTQDPTVVGIAFETEGDVHMVVATREILEVLADGFRTKAATMQYRNKPE